MTVRVGYIRFLFHFVLTHQYLVQIAHLNAFYNVLRVLYVVARYAALLIALTGQIKCSLFNSIQFLLGH